MKFFLKSVLAGLCISIGGTAFLLSDSKAVGAVFFSIGLMMICFFGLNLYTGKICYSVNQNKEFNFRLPVIWVGNLVGTLIAGLIIPLTRISEKLCVAAAAAAEAKINDSLLSIFILAIFCGILIYFAVEGFSKYGGGSGSFITLIFGVSIFVFCGFEHCIANMFYVTAANAWSLKAIIMILVTTAGNTVGGILFPLILKIKEK